MASMRDKITDIVLKGGKGCLDTTDAIIASLPEMIPELVWEYDAGWHNAGQYEIQGSLKEVDVMWSYRGRYCREVFDDVLQAKAAANAHHRASIMAAFTGDTT
jgi:hypothetical protein